MPELLRQPLRKAESSTEDLPSLVVEKCESAREYVDPPFFVEHTAFHIAALNGWPGVATQPWASRNSNDRILKLLDDQGENRRAQAKIAIGYLETRETKVKVLEAAISGVIAPFSIIANRRAMPAFRSSGVT